MCNPAAVMFSYISNVYYDNVNDIHVCFDVSNT